MSLEDLSPEQKQALALGDLAKKLVANPETGAQMKRLLMKGDPKIRFPEVELEDTIAKAQEKTSERVKELEAKLAQQEAERRQEKLHSKVKEAGLELEPVLKLMEKHGLASTPENYDLAIKVLRQDAQVAEPTTSALAPLEMPDTKEMWADPIGWRLKKGAEIQREFREGKITN